MKGIASINSVPPNTFRGTPDGLQVSLKHGGAFPSPQGGGKLDSLQVWSGKITAQMWPPGRHETLYAWSITHFKEWPTSKSAWGGIVRPTGYFWWPEADGYNVDLQRWYAITHTLLNLTEESDSIILTPHLAFSLYTAWPRATVSTSHYLPPSNRIRSRAQPLRFSEEPPYHKLQNEVPMTHM